MLITSSLHPAPVHIPPGFSLYNIPPRIFIGIISITLFIYHLGPVSVYYTPPATWALYLYLLHRSPVHWTSTCATWTLCRYIIFHLGPVPVNTGRYQHYYEYRILYNKFATGKEDKIMLMLEEGQRNRQHEDQRMFHEDCSLFRVGPEI